MRYFNDRAAFEITFTPQMFDSLCHWPTGGLTIVAVKLLRIYNLVDTGGAVMEKVGIDGQFHIVIDFFLQFFIVIHPFHLHYSSNFPNIGHLNSLVRL